MIPRRRPATAALAAALAIGAAAPARALTPPETALTERMRAAGLERVASLGGPVPAVRGYLPGAGELAVLLLAGCGAGGEASRRAALAAAGDLARTPRRHTLELVLCLPGSAAPEAARRASEAWLRLHPAQQQRDALMAVLLLEASEETGAVGLMLAERQTAERLLPPAWLAHAALGGAAAAGAGLAFGDARWPLAGQLLGRLGRALSGSGAEPFLAVRVPALSLAGAGPESGWAATLAATVRRIDGLAGRPRIDDVYVALGGRVWSRRDLYWAGLAVFVALFAAGLPGRWRGAAGAQRRRRGRRYLPRFLFRMLYLVLLLTLPVSTLLLVAPAALVALAPARQRLTVLLLRLLAVTPMLLFAVYWAAELAGGRFAAWPAHPLRLLLVTLGVALAVAAVGGGGAREEARSEPAAG